MTPAKKKSGDGSCCVTTLKEPRTILEEIRERDLGSFSTNKGQAKTFLPPTKKSIEADGIKFSRTGLAELGKEQGGKSRHPPRANPD